MPSIGHEPKTECNHDELIAKSGLIGRQILKFYRFMKLAPQADSTVHTDHDLFLLWRRQKAWQKFLAAVGLIRVADLLYTYYIGGSLTRQDQLTFARLNDLQGRAYRLTGINALACGIPTALSYFLLGEGFTLMSGLTSYAELPALIAGNATFGIGIISLSVDLFRAVDAFLNKRCWAPFGIMPLIINLPTYFRQLASKVRRRTRPFASVSGMAPIKRMRIRNAL